MPVRMKEIAIVFALFLLVFMSLSFLKVVKWNANQGDSALLSQLFENIVHKGVTYSELASNSDYYVMHNNLAPLNLEELKKRDLRMPAPGKLLKSFFSFHFYPMLYLFTPLGFIDTDILFPSLMVFSFTLMLLLCYFYLRKNGVSTVTSALFLLLVISHPAFSISIQGQLYFDRFFLGCALLFAFACSNPTRNNYAFILVSVLGWLVSERAGIILGVFALLHYAFYFQKGDSRSRIKLFVGLLFLVASYIVMKMVINNAHYSTFLIKSFSAYLNYVNTPGVIEKISIYLLFNMVFLLLSVFDWRSTAIAFIMLLPNLAGDIGGAEKTGWLTHYHTYYFPFLVWAGALGLIKLCKLEKKWLVNTALCLLVLFVCTKNPYALGFSFANLKDNLVVKTATDIKLFFFDGNAARFMALKKEYRDSIPIGSKVSAVESSWYPFWKTEHITYYPMGLGEADYAIILGRKINDAYQYSGFCSYKGASFATEIDRYLLGEMEKYGYDLKNPVYVSPWGHAVIARKKD